MQIRHTLGDCKAHSADAAAFSLKRRIAQGLSAFESLYQIRGQPGTGIFHNDLRQHAVATQADVHRFGARCVAHGVVDKIGQRAFDQLQVSVKFKLPGGGP
jgi:hypothetical protein